MRIILAILCFGLMIFIARAEDYAIQHEDHWNGNAAQPPQSNKNGWDNEWRYNQSTDKWEYYKNGKWHPENNGHRHPTYVEPAAPNVPSSPSGPSGDSGTGGGGSGGVGYDYGDSSGAPLPGPIASIVLGALGLAAMWKQRD